MLDVDLGFDYNGYQKSMAGHWYNQISGCQPRKRVGLMQQERHSKYLSVGAYICFGIAALLFVVLIILTLIYGDPKSITTDPSDPLLAQGLARYMDGVAYKKYVTVCTAVGYLCLLSTLIAFTLYGITWYRTKRGT
jgi:hypothetical protein